ncbi:DUF5677 domain-containing protein [Pseudomonas syringae]|uniref:DUF5677 domain-containing protein n=1 Tax=Pseudomonas syringae TaxID=317 RepID=UPI003F759E01
MLNKILMEIIQRSIEADALPSAGLTEWLNANADEVERHFALQMFEALDKNKEKLLADNLSDKIGFNKRLLATWGEPLNRLDSLIHMCIEILDEINAEYRLVSGSKSAQLNISTRLHARSIQISCEIVNLLKGGFADGALARWRTLHETTAILLFIANGNEDLANRFTDFQSVLKLKAANRYDKASKELGFKAISPADLTRYKTERKKILDKYEAGFGNDLGWASIALKKTPNAKTRTAFAEIEEFVGLDFLRAHYGFANQYVHAGVDSIGYKLGTSASNKDLLLCGPSNEGVIEPIQCTSLSLVQATQAIISVSPSDERTLSKTVLWLWHEKLKEEVSAASAALSNKKA